MHGVGELVYEHINALKKKTYNLNIQSNCSLITLFVCLDRPNIGDAAYYVERWMHCKKHKVTSIPVVGAVSDFDHTVL